MNLAAKLHSEDTSLADTFPGEGNEHLELDKEASPSRNGFELKFATRIILVGNRNTLVVNSSTVLFLLFGFGVGRRRRIEGAKGKVPPMSVVGAEGCESERLGSREKRKRELALGLGLGTRG